MKSKKEAFAEVLKRFQYHFDLNTVFDDFLTMTICSFGQDINAGKSHDEDLYLETVAKYKHSDLRFEFPKLLGFLILEMEERTGSSQGNDILGDYYEQNLAKKGFSQFFTPWPLCELMASSLAGSNHDKETQLRVLDPSCGSGRTLICASRRFGWQHSYYGIDIDHTCVKMAAINLFLNGVFHSELMWADALALSDFRMSYQISFLPFGIFRIKEREKSPLWRMTKVSFASKKNEMAGIDLKLPSENGDIDPNASQLTLF